MAERRDGNTPRHLSERVLILLIGSVQAVNILDFMMVMPLGPDFAQGLGIATSHLGMMGGAYTAAASVAGFVGGFFLDRFDRRWALAVAMLGLTAGTLAGAFAVGLNTLLLARVVAGIFGGPATSLALAIIADLVPVERRGRAMGTVMMAFSVASIAGVPLALKLSEMSGQDGWRMPFLAVAGMGLVVTLAAFLLLPPLRSHLSAGPVGRVRIRTLVARPEVRASYTLTVLVMSSGFLIIPNIAAYLQHNLGYPREGLGGLYLVGGCVTLGTMRFSGRLTDRLGSFWVGSAGILGVAVSLYLCFIRYPQGFPVMVLFTGFMLFNSTRNVAYQTLTSRVPRPQERARFMSLQSSIQHLSSALGAGLSSVILIELPGGRLGRMPLLGTLALLISLGVPPLLFLVQRRLRARDERAASSPGTLTGAPVSP